MIGHSRSVDNDISSRDVREAFQQRSLLLSKIYILYHRWGNGSDWADNQNIQGDLKTKITFTFIKNKEILMNLQKKQLDATGTGFY